MGRGGGEGERLGELDRWMTLLDREWSDANEWMGIAKCGERFAGIVVDVFWLASNDFWKSSNCGSHGIVAQPNGLNGFRCCYRQTEEEYSLVLTVSDGVIGEENAIKQSLLILVEDVNDNAPVFQPFANTLLVEENSLPAVILTVHATDRDQGVYGQVLKCSTITSDLPSFLLSVIFGWEEWRWACWK